MIQLGSAYGTVEIGTGDAERNVSSLASSLRRVGQTMSLAVSAPLLAVAGAGLKAAAGFEQSMDVIQSVSEATAGQMEQLQRVALQLGADTSFSAGEAAEGMLELAKAGLSVEETTAAIAGVLDLAAAGNMSVAQAAEVSANALNAFNLPAGDATKVADLLAAAANSSSVEVTDMAAAFTMASAVFASNGQSIEDLSTAIALLGDNGIKGSDAGTSLKTMLMRLTAPTDQAAAAMAALGIEVYNSDGSMREFTDIMANLEQAMLGTNAVTVTSSNLTGEQAERMQYLRKKIDSTNRSIADYQAGIAGATLDDAKRAKKLEELNQVLAAAQNEYAGLASVGGTTSTVMRQLTEEQRNEALTTIFGADAIRAANILIREGADEFDNMKESVMEAGAAQKVAAARMKGFAGAIDYAKGTIESTLIEAFLPLLDTLGNLVRRGADLIGQFGKMPEPVRNAALAFGAVLAVMGPVLVALPLIGGALAALLSPIGLIVLAVAGLAAAWAADFGGIRAKTAEAIAVVRPLLESARAWLEEKIPAGLAVLRAKWDEVWPALQTAFNMAWTAIQTGLTTAKTAIETNLPGALTTLRTAWTAGWAALGTAFNTAWSAIQNGLMTAKTAIETNLPGALTTLRTAWAAGWAALGTAFASAWAGIRDGLTTAKTAIETNLPGALTTLRGAWAAGWAALGTAFASAWAGIRDGLTTAKTAIETNLPGALTTLRGAWASGWAAVQAAFATAWAGIRSGLTTAKTAIETNLPGALTTLRTAWTAGWAALGTAFHTAKTTIETGIATIQNWFATDIPGALTTLQSTWKTMTGAVQTAWGMLVNFLQPTIDKIIAAFPLMIESFAPVGTKLQELWAVAGPVILKLNAVLGVLLVAAVKLFGETVALVMPHVGTAVGVVLDALILAFKTADIALTTLMVAFQTHWPAIQVAVQTAWTVISTAFASAMTWLTITLPANLIFLRDTWAPLWDEVKAKIDAIFGAILGIFGSIQTWLTSTLQAAVTAFQTFLGAITLPNPFAIIQSTIAGIQSAIGSAQDAIQRFRDWLGSISIPNPFAGFSIPGISGRAIGTMFAPAGMTLVGERGPEIVELPQGARVYTADQSRRMMGGTDGATINVTVNATVASEIDVQELAWRLAGQIKARMGR